MRARKHLKVEHPNLIPLIDVLFVLILFFLMTSAIVEGGLQIQVPKLKASDTTKPIGADVAVEENGRISFEGKVLKNADDLQVELEKSLKEKRVEKTRAVIHAHKDIKYQDVMSVMSACKLAGFEKIVLAGLPVAGAK